jgi:hypothetical protein
VLQKAVSRLSLEIPDTEIKTLEQALNEDAKGGVIGVGAKTAQWLKSVAPKVGKAGIKAGASIAQDVIKEWLLRYWGLN